MAVDQEEQRRSLTSGSGQEKGQDRGKNYSKLKVSSWKEGRQSHGHGGDGHDATAQVGSEGTKAGGR